MGRVLDWISEDEYDSWQERERQRKQEEASRQVEQAKQQPTPWQQAYSAPSFPAPSVGASVPSSGMTAPYVPPVAPQPEPNPEPTPWQRAFANYGQQQAQQQQEQQQLEGQGFGQVVGTALEPAGRALDWLNRNVWGPSAELRYGATFRDELPEQPVPVPNEYLFNPTAAQSAFQGGQRLAQDVKDTGNLGAAWQRAYQRWEETPEAVPGAKGFAESIPMTGSLSGVPIEKGIQLARRSISAAREALPQVAQAAREALPEAGRVAKQGAQAYFDTANRLPQFGQSVQEVERPATEAVEQAKRYYHGTGSTFDVPEAGKFDENGLYGPGYYMTDNADVAGSYATSRAANTAKASQSNHELINVLGDIQDLELRQQRLERQGDVTGAATTARELEGKRQALEAIKTAMQAGSNIRPIDVPQNLMLFDADAPVDAVTQAKVIAAVRTKYGVDAAHWLTTDLNRYKLMDDWVSGDALYNHMRNDLGITAEKAVSGSAQTDSLRAANELLQSIGYDGIRYQGGKRIPMKDAAGNPIQHEAVVIFPESLPKITNALSKTQGGFMQPGTALDLAAGTVGGASQYDPNASPEENALRVGAGALVGAGLMRAGRTGKLGLSVEDVGKGAPKPNEQGWMLRPGDAPPGFPSKAIQGGEVKAEELFKRPMVDPTDTEAVAQLAREELAKEREQALRNGQIDMFGATPAPETQSPLVPATTPEQIAQRAADVEVAMRQQNTSIPVSQIHLDPERFQYKIGSGEGGSTGSLKGVSKWNPALAQGVMVWKDPASGKVFVVNGHNRVTAAKRLGIESLDNPYWIDAPNATEARALGAMTNIAEGHGTALDAAKFFRDSGLSLDQALQQLPSRQRIVTDGLALSRLNEGLFNKVVQGEMPVERGAIIGARLEDHTLQSKLVGMLDQQAKKGRRITNDVVSELADMVAGAPRQTSRQTKMWGDEEMTDSLAIEKAEVLADIKGRLSHDKRVFGLAANNATDLERGGNVIQREASQNISENAAQLLAMFDTVKHHVGGVSGIIDDAAKRIGAGESAAKVKADAYEQVVKALSETKAGSVEARVNTDTAIPRASGAQQEAAPATAAPSELAPSSPLPQEATTAAPIAPAATTAKQPWERTYSDIDASYLHVSDTVDGRQIGESIPNLSSIESSIDNPTELKGIREVPIAAFEDSGPPKFISATEEERTRQLAEEIRQSGRIDPLIIVDDGQASPYVLEGGHRFDALKLLGAKSFPAKVVVDEDAYYSAVKQALSEGRPVPDAVLKDYPDLAAKAKPPIKPDLTPPEPIKANGDLVTQEPATTPSLPENIPANAALTLVEPPQSVGKAVEVPVVEAAQPLPGTITPTEPPGPPTAQPPKPPGPPPTVVERPRNPNNWLPEIKSTDELVHLAYQPDWLRRATDRFDNVITRNVAQAIGEPMRDIFSQGLVTWETVKANWRSGAVGAMARLRKYGGSDKLFEVDKDGYAHIGRQPIAMGDLAEYPDRYDLNPTQRAYIKDVHKLLDDMTERLTENDIDIRQMRMEQGGHWVPRRAMGKLNADGEMELVQVGSGMKARPGAKASFEKQRSYYTEEEALADGVRYLSLEETLNATLQSAGRKIADQRLVDLILPQIPYRTGAAPEALRASVEMASRKLRAVNAMQAVILRGYRGERVPQPTIASIGRHYPAQAKVLYDADITKMEDAVKRAAFQGVERQIPLLKRDAQDAYKVARKAYTKAKAKAQQPKLGEATVAAPAFQGKFFSQADAATLRRVMDIEESSNVVKNIRGGAEAMSALNAIPRLLQTTFDIGTPFIQGLPTLVYRPIKVWGPAYKEMIKAIASEEAQQRFYAANADVMKWMSENGATLTRSEFSQALDRGTITQRGLSKVPIVGKTAVRASRGYETYLNALRILGVKATRHMAKTPEDARGLMRFWDEMSGQLDTTVMGVNATQRATETAALYAPRYWRSTLSLVGDIARGGLRGEQARSAVSHLLVGGLLGYVGVSYALGQEPHLDPTDKLFLTVNIAGQPIGPGGAFVSLSKVLATMVEHPEKTHEAAANYLLTRAAPIPGTLVSIMRYPYYYDSFLDISENVIASNLLPFSVNSMLFDRHVSPEAAVVSGLAEGMGGRSVQPPTKPVPSSNSKTAPKLPKFAPPRFTPPKFTRP